MRAGWVKRTVLFIVTPVAAVGLPTVAITTAAVTALDAPPAAAAVAPVSTCTKPAVKVRPLVLDQPMSGCLTSPGDLDTWDFTVVSTSANPTGVWITPELSVPLQSFQGGQGWSLVDDQGRQYLASANAPLATAAPIFLPLGHYTLTVRQQLDSWGAFGRILDVQDRSFTFALRRVPAADLFNVNIGDTIPDNAVARAPIPTPAPTAGNIDVPYAMDEYFFTVPAGGQRLAIETLAGGFAANQFVIRDSQGRQVRYGSIQGGTAPFFLAPDTYSLTVFSAGGTATYRLKLWSVPAASSPVAVGGITSTVKQINGSIDQNGEVDTYSFSVAGATMLDVSINTCYTPASITFPNGFVTALPATCGPDYYIPVPAAGTYQISVRADRSYGVTRAYTFGLTAGSAQPATSQAYVRSVVAPTSLGTLATPSTTAGSGTRAAGAADVYTFTGTAGQRAFFRYGSQAGTSTNWRLQAPDGTPLFTFTNVSFVNSVQAVTLPTSGLYTLVVFDTTTTSAGSEAFTIDIADTPALSTSLGTIDPLAATPRVLSASGALVKPGEQDYYTFNATAGQKIYAKYTSVSNQTMRWDLFAPDGTWVLNSAGGTFSGVLGYAGAFTLMQTGTYRLRVHDQQGIAGTYGFDITQVKNTQAFNIGSFDAATASLSVQSTSGGQTATTTTAGTTTTASAPGAGSTDAANPQDAYTFRGVAGQRVYVRRTSGPSSVSWQISDPAGFSIKIVKGDYSFYQLPIDTDLGDFRLPRSGNYTITVWGDGVSSASFGFDVVSIPRSQVFALGATPSAGVVAIPNTTTALATDGAGSLRTPGDKDLYTFEARNGQQLNFLTGSMPSGVTLYAKLLGPDGMIVDCCGHPRYVYNDALNSLPPVVPITRDGQYTLIIYGRDAAFGAYGLSLSVTGTATAPLRDDPPFNFALDKTTTTATAIAPNDPMVGTGLLEDSTALDVFTFDAESGDAVDFVLNKTDLALRQHYIEGFSSCQPTASPYISWTVRDPEGDVIADQTFTCETAHTGLLVLGERGTYTVSVGRVSTLDSYDLNVYPVPLWREAAQPGQNPPPAALTRITPSSAPTGTFATVSILGTSLAQPTAVHITKAGVSLPVTLLDAKAVHGSSESVAAHAEVDLTNAALGDYSVSVDLTGGGTITLPPQQHFTVEAAFAADDVQLDVTELGFDNLRPGTLNRAYINIANGMPFDIMVDASIGVPDWPSVQLLNDTHPERVLEMMRAQGMSAAQLTAIAAALPPKYVRTDPELGSDGTSVLAANLRVPAFGSVVLPVEVVPPAEPDLRIPAGAFTTGALTAAATTAADTSSGGAAPTAPSLPAWLCGLLNGMSEALDVDGWIPDKSGLVDGAYDKAKQMFKDLLNNANHNYGGDVVPPGLIDAAASAMAGAVVSFAEAWMIIAIPIALFIGWATGQPVDQATQQRIDQLTEFLKGAVARRAVDDIIESLELKKPIKHVKKTVDWLRRHGCDPNALIGPGQGMPFKDGTLDVMDGGPIQAGDRAPYEAEFENVGDAAVRRVGVTVPLSPDLDPATFTLDSVRIGTTDIDMAARGDWQMHGEHDVPINGTTNRVIVDSTFTPDQCPTSDPCSGTLVVKFAGPPLSDQFGLLDTSSDILPPNTTEPAGEGSIHFSAAVRRNLTAGDFVEQPPATIVFDTNAPLDTNAWRNVIPTDHPTAGPLLQLKDNPLSPKGRKLTLRLSDPAFLTVADPRQAGMRLRVKTDLGEMTYLLPAIAWKQSTAYYRYVGALSKGAIMAAKLDLRHGILTIKGRGDKLGHSLVQAPTVVDVSVIVGTDRYCGQFRDPQKVPTVKLWQRKYAPKPTTCNA